MTNEKIEGYILDLMRSVGDIKKDLEYIKADKMIITDLSQRVLVLERSQDKKVATRWEKIKDKLFDLLYVIVIGAVIAFFNIKIPKL